MPGLSHNGEEGVFILSLDFELFWGLRDILTKEACRETLFGARRAIPEILALFSGQGIHATWATVGFLFYSGRDELLENLPGLLPAYKDSSLSPYPAIAGTGNSEEEDPLHYAPSLVKQISATPGQEVATHTFSHYYCLEKGQTAETFRADIEAACKTAALRGIKLRSLVFPRNQFNEEYLSVCREQGIIAYRGNQQNWMYRASTTSGEPKLKRLARLTDAYINLSGFNGHPATVLGEKLPFNIPASRLLRSVSSRLKVLEPLRLQRIKKEMSHAAENGLVYHLWWHPHNFGNDISGNIAFLRQILRHYRQLRERYGMRSMSMAEIAEQAQQKLSR